MALSKLEAELNKATGIKFDGGKRQAYLRKIQQFCADDENGMVNARWDALSGPAQKWANAATRAWKDRKDIPDFPEADEPRQERRSRSRDDDNDDKGDKDDKGAKDDKGSKGAKGKDEEAPSRGRRSAREEEPAPRGRGKDKEEEKTERGGGRGGKDAKGDSKPIEGVKVDIKRMLIKDIEMSTDDIHKKLGKTSKMSKVTVGNLRAEFRHSLKVLKQEGNLKGIDI